MNNINAFGQTLQYYLKQTNTKASTLAVAIKYDLSYISKWQTGKMLPSEKNIESIIDTICRCVMSGDINKLLEDYSCSEEQLMARIRMDFTQAYALCRPKPTINKFYPNMHISEIISVIDKNVIASADIVAVTDILAMPHEYRLILAGIKENHFSALHWSSPKKYKLAINVNSSDCVYDSIFLIHMLTSLSSIDFSLYNNPYALGKIIYCTDSDVVSAGLFPGNKECFFVNIFGNEMDIHRNIDSLFVQENLMFKKTTLKEMLGNREYIQTLISTGISWVIGHTTELLLPEDVFTELLEQSNMNIPEYRRHYNLIQNVLHNPTNRIMIYESAISYLTVDGIVDFFNMPVQLTDNQILRCISYYYELININASIRLIDGGFSEDFRYITNPCMLLSDSICYLRLENGKYSNNIMLLNDRTIKKLFYDFFDEVWNNRKDVVSSEKTVIKDKIDHYLHSANAMLKLE